jgi:amidase
MMDGEAYLSLREISDLIRSKKISPRELTSALLRRIGVVDRRLQSFVTITGERALEMAQIAQREIERGTWRGPLHGIPIALKDLIDTRYAPTSVGMPALRRRIPSQDATVVERLEAAGAITLGKLAMTEGAFTSHHPDMPTPRNPWNELHWTGVSSSGAGVSTAAGLCYGSIASDTGGSIRFPASACGVTGVKPTWGRVSRHGVFPLAETLDHVGPMARSAADAAIILGAIAGKDPADSTSLSAPVPDYLSLLQLGVDRVRIGIDERALSDRVATEIGDAVTTAARVLEERGARRISISVPALGPIVDCFMRLCACEASLAHRATYAEYKDAYGPALSALIDQGEAISGPAIAQAHIERRRWSGELAAVFDDVDLLIVPAIPVPVPKIAQMATIAADASVGLARFTIPFSMSGSPTITLPAGFDGSGLPIGVQLVGSHLCEDLILRAGHAFQQVTDWHMHHPRL